MIRTAVCQWLNGHEHTEGVKCLTKFEYDIPRLLRVGYDPHFTYFIYIGMHGHKALYRQANESGALPNRVGRNLTNQRKPK